MKRAATGIGLHVNAHMTECMLFNQTGDISTLKGNSLKLIFIFCGLFCPHLGSFRVVSSFTMFRPNFTSGLLQGILPRPRIGLLSLVTVSPVIAAFLESKVSSTETDIDTRLTKARTAINRLLIIWKSDLTDKMKRSFFQAAVVLILLYGCITWTLTKRTEKKFAGNYTRMLRAILNKTWRQHPTKQQLYSHLPPITKRYKD